MGLKDDAVPDPFLSDPLVGALEPEVHTHRYPFPKLPLDLSGMLYRVGYALTSYSIR